MPVLIYRAATRSRALVLHRMHGFNAERASFHQGLYQSIESNLELAKHAEGWIWAEVTSKSHD